MANHERILKAAILCDFDLVVEAFLEDPQVKGRASREQVEELVRDMLRSTAKYLPEGWKSICKNKNRKKNPGGAAEG